MYLKTNSRVEDCLNLVYLVRYYLQLNTCLMNKLHAIKYYCVRVLYNNNMRKSSSLNRTWVKLLKFHMTNLYLKINTRDDDCSNPVYLVEELFPIWFLTPLSFG